MKICKSCNETKSQHDFHKWKYGKDGLKRCCKSCIKLKAAKYYKENKESCDTRNAVYRQNNIKEERLRCRDYARGRQDINRETNKKWYKKNKEYKLEKNRLWYKNNPEKRKEIQNRKARRRRAREVELKEDFRHESIVHAVFDNKCFMCCAKDNLTLDHHVPLSKGFILSAHNCVILCRSCNSKKGTADPAIFYNKSQLKILTLKFKEVSELINV